MTFNGTLAANGSFETPDVGGGIVSQPVGASWNFVTTSAGITGNGNGFTSGNPNAPDGVQVAYIQFNAAIWQSFNFAAGTYTIGFRAAERGNYNASYQQLQVSLLAQNPVASTKQFVWIGNSIAEERDANNVITKRFYPQGVQLTQPSTLNLFYTRDHLGSIRELTDSTQAIRARYDYDPYGARTKLSGDLDADFAYTGHYFHQPSGLNLALCRGYDASKGRWITRDPIAEEGGINLYAYVQNNPINLWDPLGLIELSYTPNDTIGNQLLRQWEKTYDNPRAFDVAGHGNRDYMYDQLRRQMTPDQVAKDIVNHPDFKPGMPVNLISCETGKGGAGSFGDRLSKAIQALTGVHSKVTAPEKPVGPKCDKANVPVPRSKPQQDGFDIWRRF